MGSAHTNSGGLRDMDVGLAGMDIYCPLTDALVGRVVGCSKAAAGWHRPLAAMMLGRVGAFSPSSVNRAGIAQRRFLAKQAGGKKKKGGTPKKGPAAIKARGAIPAPKASGKHGSAGANAGAATGAAGAKPPPTAAAGASSSGGGISVGVGGGGGFTKSEMLAARKARKASLNEKNAAAAAATAAAKASEGVVSAAAATAAAAGAKGPATGAAGGKGKWGWGSKFLAGTTAGLAVLGIAWQLKPDEVRRLLDDSPVDHFAIWLMGKYALYSSPVKEKLLLDCPVPPGALPPPTLVLDLEGTLLGTIYTRKKGWRVAKRPGLDAFLKEMAQLYEIVVFTDSVGGLADEWITQMDPLGTISQRVYRDGTRYIDGKYVKDLSALNRPLEQTIIIDDNADCISMQPENAVKVKPFSLEDGSDPTTDTVLYDLAPFLRALATQGVADFRDVLRPHAGEDSSSVVSDFRSKVNAVRQKEEAERSRGLGGLVRQIAPAVGGGGSGGGMGGMLTSKDIVGDAPETLSPGMAAAAAASGSRGGGGGAKPLPAEKKGGFFNRLAEGNKEREEMYMRKNEVFQRVMEKRMAREKAKREEQEREAQQQLQ